MAKKSTQELDLEAREEARTGANKKKFHDKDLVTIYPKTPTQEDVFHLWVEDKSMYLTGCPGTGKTFLSLYLGLRDVLDEGTPYRKLVLVRSIVPSREVGFLPGSLEEKIDVYEAPYKAICDSLFPYKNTYENLKKNNYLSFEPTSFLRGLTWDNSVIVVDEFQNMSFQEANTVITRVGENSKIVFAGDSAQTDLGKKHDQSGFHTFTEILSKMASFKHIHFTKHDIVRGSLVKEYIMVKEDLGL